MVNNSNLACDCGVQFVPAIFSFVIPMDSFIGQHLSPTTRKHGFQVGTPHLHCCVPLDSECTCRHIHPCSMSCQRQSEKWMQMTTENPKPMAVAYPYPSNLSVWLRDFLPARFPPSCRCFHAPQAVSNGRRTVIQCRTDQGSPSVTRHHEGMGEGSDSR
jgi:hypothetical protein